MSLKTLKALGALHEPALIVFEARNRLRGAIEGIRRANDLPAAPDAAAIATAFPAATAAQRTLIGQVIGRLEAALAGLDGIADTLPANDLPDRVP